MNDDANLTTPENKTTVVETPENDSSTDAIETSVLPLGDVVDTNTPTDEAPENLVAPVVIEEQAK